MRINSEDKICILRSAFLGDWISTIPFLIYLTEVCCIPVENIYIIIINNSGFNPIEKVLGPNSLFTKNSLVVNSLNFKTTYKSALFVRKNIYNKVNRMIYLPFTYENRTSILKKYILSFFLCKFNIKKNGFIFFNKYKIISSSQYFSFFQKLDIEFDLNKISVKAFLEKQSIHFSKKASDFDKVRIAVYPNSKLKMKIWPIENYIKVLESLYNKYNAEFYLIGSAEDYHYNQLLIDNSNKKINIQNIAGVLDISSTITFLSNVDLLLTNDGAPVHMGSLVNTPVVGLYTYKEPIGSWDPILSKKYIIIRTEVLCKNCFSDNCLNPVCIKYIPASIVVNACDDILDGKINGRENKVLIPQSPLSFKSINN